MILVQILVGSKWETMGSYHTLDAAKSCERLYAAAGWKVRLG